MADSQQHSGTPFARGSPTPSYDPRVRERWHILQIREAIATAVWAYQVGDERFEAEGHRRIADLP